VIVCELFGAVHAVATHIIFGDAVLSPASSANAALVSPTILSLSKCMRSCTPFA
jgi:hypothetical protein